MLLPGSGRVNAREASSRCGPRDGRPAGTRRPRDGPRHDAVPRPHPAGQEPLVRSSGSSGLRCVEPSAEVTGNDPYTAVTSTMTCVVVGE